MTDLSGLGVASGGVWTRWQALRLMSVGRYDAAVRRGAWQTLWPGVHTDGGHVPDAEQRAWAAVLASGGADQEAPEGLGAGRLLVAYACGRTAARCWQFPLVDDDDPATGADDARHDDVGVFRNVPDLLHGGRALHRRQLRLRVGDVVRLPSGLWMTSPRRTLADCAGLLSTEALVCCLDDALHRYLVHLPDLERQAAAMHGARDAPALRRAMSLTDGRAESPAETLARLLLRPHLPGLVPQVELFDERAAPVACFDLADETVRLAVEADGRRGHAGSEMAARDRRRDRRSRALGWDTERLTWFDLRRRRSESVQRVLAADAAQRLRYGRPPA